MVSETGCAAYGVEQGWSAGTPSGILRARAVGVLLGSSALPGSVLRTPQDSDQPGPVATCAVEVGLVGRGRVGRKSEGGREVSWPAIVVPAPGPGCGRAGRGYQGGPRPAKRDDQTLDQ